MQAEEPQWDSVAGVWVGERAPALHAEDIPNPLYIFGYGSLIWRPGALMQNLPSFHCSAIGYKRLFAQKSCDHRGTAEFPGVVLNLVSDEELVARGYPVTSASECEGVVWLVPPDLAVELIMDLDFREKGGYHRHLLPVRLREATPHYAVGEVVSALVYTGAPSNPNFFLAPSPSLSKALLSLERSTRFAADPFGLLQRNVVVDIIACARGPSGANADYLFNLVQFLEDRGMQDEYLERLAVAVRLRIGPWRLHHYHAPRAINAVGDNELPWRTAVAGWGSNEFHQLHSAFSTTIAQHATKLFSESDAIPNTGEDGACGFHWQAAECAVVLAGGGSTGILSRHPRRLPQLELRGAVADLLASLQSRTINERRVVLHGVVGAALGVDHALLLLTSGQVVTVGGPSLPDSADGHQAEDSDSKPNDCSFVLTADPQLGDGHFLLSASLHRAALLADTKPLKLAAGLHLSAIITLCGGLAAWGKRWALGVPVLWRPASGAKLLDVACGNQLVVVLDEQGVVYTFGAGRHGALGRELASSAELRGDKWWQRKPEPVDLPNNVRFQRITCGWAHCVARGITATGKLVFYAWGRRDMAQYVPSVSSPDWWRPQQLAPLPDGAQLAEVWCGSEFTIAADHHGELWGSGWNEHANVAAHADASASRVVEGWRRIGDPQYCSPRLQYVWEGALACGGGHVVCIRG